MLARKSLSYPDFLPKNITFLESTTIIDTLKRIQVLSALGGSYLNVYSLIPYIFLGRLYGDLDCDVLCSLSKNAVENFDAVKTLGNVCALCGVIFLILTGNVPKQRKKELFDELYGLMKEIPPNLFSRCIGHFSFEGKVLAHEAGMAAYRETDHEKKFYSTSCHEILKSLEALPVDRSKLPTPGVPCCV